MFLKFIILLSLVYTQFVLRSIIFKLYIIYYLKDSSIPNKGIR